jgi:hypothetical protein
LISKESIEGIQKLSNMSKDLQNSATALMDISMAAATFTSINSFADSITKLTESLGKLNENLRLIESEKLSKLSSIANISAARIGTNAEVNTDTVKTNKFDTSGIEEKLDKLTSLLVGGAVRVYLDKKLMNSAMALDSQS